MNENSIDFKKVFSKKSLCDFCGEENAFIILVITRPIYRFNKNCLNIIGINHEKKCNKCIEEEINDWEQNEMDQC